MAYGRAGRGVGEGGQWGGKVQNKPQKNAKQRKVWIDEKEDVTVKRSFTI